MINVRDLGAVGDGATDDTEAFNAALSQGTHVYVPSGKYLISGSLKTLDFSDSQSAEEDNNRVTLSGDGMFNTKILYRGDWACIKVVGGTAGTGNFSGLCIRDLQLSGSGEPDSRGIYANIAPYLCLERVYINGFGMGLEAYNSDFVQIDKCLIRWNTQGIYATDHSSGGAYATRPNKWNVRDTSISINSWYGAFFWGAATCTFDGCDIANNGMGGNQETWGLRFSGGSPEGSGHDIRGCYFEENKGIADLWLQPQESDNVYQGVYNVTACSFNRTGAFNGPSANCNVLCQFRNGGGHKLVLTGNAFKAYGGYAGGSNYTVTFDSTNGNEPQTAENFIAFGNVQQIKGNDKRFWDRF